MIRALILFTILLAPRAVATSLAADAAPPESVLGQNAALTYWRAFALMPQLEGDTDWQVTKAVTQFTLIDPELAVVIRQSDAALAELRRAVRQTDCAWGTAWEEGPRAQLPHLEKARQLARLACLRARREFEESRKVEAIKDLLAAMTLARHTGKDGAIVSVLVQLAIERNVVDVAAAYLPKLSKDEMELVAAGLQRLPAGGTVRAAIRMEEEVYGAWLVRILGNWDGKALVLELFEGTKNSHTEALSQLSREEMAEAAKGLAGFYRRLAQLPRASLAATEQREAVLLSAQLENVRHFAGLVLPAVQSARRVETCQLTRLAMLRAAIAVLREGPQVLDDDKYQDPFTDGPFDRVRWDDAFQLRSKLKDHRGKQIVLVVGGVSPAQ